MNDRELLKKHFKLLMQAKEAGYITDEERAMMYEFARRGTVREEIDTKARQAASQGIIRHEEIARRESGSDLDVIGKLLAENSDLSAEIEQARTILAGTAIGSLPNDYPLSKLALEAWNTFQERTLEGMSLIGRLEEILNFIDNEGPPAQEWKAISDWCDRCRAAIKAHYDKSATALRVSTWYDTNDPDSLDERGPHD